MPFHTYLIGRLATRVDRGTGICQSERARWQEGTPLTLIASAVGPARRT